MQCAARGRGCMIIDIKVRAAVDQQVREWERKLRDFRNDPSATTLELPSSLSSTQRKRLHVVAEKLGLNHESSGTDDERCLVVSKRDTNANANASSSSSSSSATSSLSGTDSGAGRFVSKRITATYVAPSHERTNVTYTRVCGRHTEDRRCGLYASPQAPTAPRASAAPTRLRVPRRRCS